MIVPRMSGRLLNRGLAGLLALLAGVALFQALQAPIVDSFGGPQRITSLIGALPPQFQAIAMARPELVGFSGLAGSLAFGFTHPIYIMLTVAAIVGFASRALAGEMERGTIQLVLSRPVSRSAVYGARVIGLLLIGAGLSLAGPLGMIAGVLLVQTEGELVLSHFLPLGIGTFLLFWAIGGLALAASAAASTTGRVVGWAITFVAVSYFIDYFADLWDILKPFEFLSIFNYYDPAQALIAGELAWSDVLVLAMIGLTGVIAGLVIFDRRDLPT